MDKKNRQIDDITKMLSPTKILLLWLEDVLKFGSLREYILRPDKKEEGTIRDILFERASSSVRNQLKGEKENVVQKEIFKACSEVDFLYMLIIKINEQVESTHLSDILSQKLFIRELTWLKNLKNRNTVLGIQRILLANLIISVLDPETVSTIKYIQNNSVITFNELNDYEIIFDWVNKYYIDQGKIELPINLYELVKDSTKKTEIPSVAKVFQPPDDVDLNQFFTDERQIAEFLQGDNYSYGLGGVDDCEFAAVHDKLLNDIKRLVKSKKLVTGRKCKFESVPLPYLTECPLIEDVWLDLFIAELAEWGALIEQNGFKRKSSTDTSPFVWACFYKKKETENFEFDSEHLIKLREQAKAQLAAFGGRKKKIDNRIFIHIDDYLDWEMKNYKNPILFENGFTISSWNNWISSFGPDKIAELSGLPVGKIRSHIPTYRLIEESDPEIALGERKRRSEVLQCIEGMVHSGDPIEKHIKDLNSNVKQCVIANYSINYAINFIRKKYFENQNILFNNNRADLRESGTLLKELISEYNSFIEGESKYQIDPEKLKDITLFIARFLVVKLTSEAEASMHPILKC